MTVASELEKIESLDPYFGSYYTDFTDFCHLYLFIGDKDMVEELTNRFYDFYQNEVDRRKAYRCFKDINDSRESQFCLHTLRKKCSSTQAWNTPDDSYNVTHFVNSLFIHDTFRTARFKRKRNVQKVTMTE